MRSRVLCGMLSSALVVSGCAPGPLDDSAWPEARPPGRQFTAVRPPGSPNATNSALPSAEPVGIVSLRDALAAALLGSPDLAALGYEVRAREAEALQAGRFPNPDLEIELENFGGTGERDGFDALETTLALSQFIELGGKRVKRQRVGDYQARIAGWEYEIRRIDVLSKTAADFVGLLAARRRSRSADATLELAQRVFDAVGERVDAGKISPVERTKARVELAQTRLTREQALREIAAARVRLASNWGSTDPQFDDLSGDLDDTESPPTLESLLGRIEQNPDIARWAADAALRHAEIELALSQRIPDLTVAGGVRYANDIDETAFVAGLSLPLPIFDQNQGGIQAARLRALQGGRFEEAARVQTRAAVTQAFQILDAAFVRAHITRDEILPSAVLAFEAADEAFRQGKIGAIDLLDAERTLIDARRQLTDSLITYHLAVIASERLIGSPLHDVNQVEGSDK